jgi:hypothetical protein
MSTAEKKDARLSLLKCESRKMFVTFTKVGVYFIFLDLFDLEKQNEEG